MLNIPQHGAFILSIKDPEKPAPPGVGLAEQDEALYPKSCSGGFESDASPATIPICSASKVPNLS